MKNKQVVFRVDGSAQIGLGHLVRCMALGEMLRNHFEITFACREIPQKIIQELELLNIRFLKISTEDEFIEAITEDHIVIVDHYELNTGSQHRIKEKGCVLICIDDLNNQEYYCDLIINQAPGIRSSDYKAQPYTRFALGLNYALLRNVFLKEIKLNQITKEEGTVYTCFGGSDPKNITCLVAEILKQDSRFKKINIVTGAGYTNLDSLIKLTEGDVRFFLYNAIDGEIQCKLMAESELAIVPSSGILQEALAMKCKVISGMYIENQQHVLSDFKNLGALINAENFSKKGLLAAIERSFTEKNFCNLLFDGNSGSRLLDLISQFNKKKTLVLRQVNKNDLIQTYEWAKSKEVRKYSFNRSLISFEAHQSWFKERLNDPDSFMYIAEIDQLSIGSIRFNVENEEAMISYLLDPAYQGKGLGEVLLHRGLEKFLLDFKGSVSRIYGDVMNENLASIHIFKKSGFTEDAQHSESSRRFSKYYL